MSGLPKVLSERELREYLRLVGPSKARTWARLKPFFAPAVVALPLTTRTEGGYRLYDEAKVRALLEARRHTNTGLSRSRALRKVG